MERTDQSNHKHWYEGNLYYAAGATFKPLGL